MASVNQDHSVTTSFSPYPVATPSKYGKAVGRLPKVLRSGIGTAAGILILDIHKGSHSWFVSRWSGNIRIYTEFTQNKYDEENRGRPKHDSNSSRCECEIAPTRLPRR